MPENESSYSGEIQKTSLPTQADFDAVFNNDPEYIKLKAQRDERLRQLVQDNDANRMTIIGRTKQGLSELNHEVAQIVEQNRQKTVSKQIVGSIAPGFR